MIKKRLLRNGDKNQGIMEDIYEKLCANIYKEVLWREALLNRQQESRDTWIKIYIWNNAMFVVF